jgi:S-DNA-T family DNA segregation ATPase FtsK/SpoIIIE
MRDPAPGPGSGGAGAEPARSSSDDADDLFDRAVAIVHRDQKASTSYLQRRLSIGYNRAADLIERMEKEGLISAPDSVGRRRILGGPDDADAAE